MVGVRNYAIVTASYWSFMVTDGALRMLVLLHFNQLGYSPLQLSLLFVLYEAMGMVTNLAGGWIATRFGLTLTLYTGLLLQATALLVLSGLDPTWSEASSVIFVLLVQGVSGVAKDLSKTSAKSAIKKVVPENSHSTLFAWVEFLVWAKYCELSLGPGRPVSHAGS